MDEVLHCLRLKGIASPESIAEALGSSPDVVLARLRELESDGAAMERASRKRPGWVLSEVGRARHAAELGEAHTPATREALSERYKGFLELNGDVKALAARWQQALSDEARFVLIERLEDLHDNALNALTSTGELLPRFGRYGTRLSTALDRLEDDPRFFVSPLVDSYHTVWFECHEDFLLTLGRTRASEGSE
jgi:hypothetical protein